MNRVWSVLSSLRTTVVLMIALAALLLLNVVLPQAGGATREAHDAVIARSPLMRFVLVDLGLGDIPSSRAFLGVLGLFFLNLTAVFGTRASATVRRVRFRPPGPAQVSALLERGSGGEAARPAGWRPGHVAALLASLGYRTANVDEGGVWGVKHRLAPLGFLLFHASFFVLWAAGILLWGTRQVGLLTAVEGQTVGTAEAAVVRRAPWGGARSLRLSVNRVFVGLASGKPVSLGAELVPDGAGGESRTARVNHPAVWGDLVVLVEAAGIAPVLWLQDERGYTLDRVAVVARAAGRDAARSPLGQAGLSVAIEPIPIGERFPERPALPTTAISLRIEREGETLYAGRLRPGERARVGNQTVVLSEVRYWVGLRLVHERGGALLVAGFLLGVAGIAWRMLWYRREILVVWSESGVRFAGRAEFFPDRYERELADIRALVLHSAAEGGRGASATGSEA